MLNDLEGPAQGGRKLNGEIVAEDKVVEHSDLSFPMQIHHTANSFLDPLDLISKGARSIFGGSFPLPRAPPPGVEGGGAADGGGGGPPKIYRKPIDIRIIWTPAKINSIVRLFLYAPTNFFQPTASKARAML